MLDSIAADLGEVLGLAWASTLASINHAESDWVASSALDAAEVLTRTVQEQVADIATITTRLEDDLRTVGLQAAAAVEASPASIGGDAPGSARASPRTYAPAAAVVSHPPACAAALAKAAARTRQVLIERAPGMERWMEGMTEKLLLEKARSAVTMMPSGGTALGGAKFVGVQLLRGGGFLLHMNDEATARWLKANMGDFQSTRSVCATWCCASFQFPLT